MDMKAWRAAVRGHGPDIPGSYEILLFTALDLASITSHIHSWVLFLLWLCLFILSGVISPLISSSILDTYWPGEFIFQSPVFCLFILFMGFSRQEYWSGLRFPCLLLLSRFSRVQLCVTPKMAAHLASPSLGFSRQEHCSEFPFPSPMQKWKWSCSVVSDS